MTTKLPKNSLPLRVKLAAQRPMTSLLEREMSAVTDAFEFNRENWVDALVDAKNTVSFDRGQTTAYRAVAFHEQALFWLVRTKSKKHGYHSSQVDPLAAVEEAHEAWERRRQVRRNWRDIEVISSDLLSGRQRFRVTASDAYASPLCTLGIQGWLQRHRLPKNANISGRTAAFFMKFEPQLGFVIHEAWKRHEAEKGSEVEALLA